MFNRVTIVRRLVIKGTTINIIYVLNVINHALNVHQFLIVRNVKMDLY